MNTPDITIAQTDIGFANNYRIELIKQGLLFAVGIFAFTVSAFLLSNRPMPTEIFWRGCLYIGWSSLIISMACGLAHLYCWEAIYISYHDYNFKAGKESDENKKSTLLETGDNYRDMLHSRRKKFRIGQFGGFVLGSILIALFTGKALLLPIGN